jgi:hypothetical protein
MRKKPVKIMFGVAAVMAISNRASADDSRVFFDWERAIVQLDGYVRGDGDKASAANARSEASARSSELAVHNAGNAWFGVAPSVTFVARDWGSAYRIAGDRLSIVDALRLSGSTRMVLSRVRLGDPRSTRLVPFVQLGAGQWRVDPKLMPLMPRYRELAAQLGGGVELALTKHWQLACESTMTALYVEQTDAQDQPQMKMWGASVASRFEF